MLRAPVIRSEVTVLRGSLIFQDGLYHRPGFSFCFHGGRLRFPLDQAAFHFKLDGQIFAACCALLAGCIKLAVYQLLHPANLHALHICLCLYSFAPRQQVCLHAVVHCILHLARHVSFVEPVDEQLRDFSRAEDTAVGRRGEQATAQLPGCVARDAASKIDALLIDGVTHDDDGARKFFG